MFLEFYFYFLKMLKKGERSKDGVRDSKLSLVIIYLII